MMTTGRAALHALLPRAVLVATSIVHLVAPSRAQAQVRPEQARAAGVTMVSLRGVVFDSLRNRPVARALVEVANLPHTTMSDDEGRFRIDSLPAGKLRLTFSAPSLDSLGLFAFVTDVETAAARSSDVRLSTPSFQTMYTRLCASTDQPPRDSAIVFGAVRNASSNAVVGAALVSFRWAAATTTSNAVRLEAVREARTATDGTYGVCGLPESQLLNAQAFTNASASTVAQLTVGAARIMRVDLVVDSATALSVAADLPPEASGATVPMGPDQAAFRARKALRNGIFLEQDAFRTHNEMGQVLLRVRGIGVERINAKYRYTASGRTCPPALLIDGEPRTSIDDDLQNLSPREVRALEYHSLNSKVLAPELLRGVIGCGDVLLIWTNRARW